MKKWEMYAEEAFKKRIAERQPAKNWKTFADTGSCKYPQVSVICTDCIIRSNDCRDINKSAILNKKFKKMNGKVMVPGWVLCLHNFLKRVARDKYYSCKDFAKTGECTALDCKYCLCLNNGKCDAPEDVVKDLNKEV